jgi:hypothetical protein
MPRLRFESALTLLPPMSDSTGEMTDRTISSDDEREVRLWLDIILASRFIDYQSLDAWQEEPVISVSSARSHGRRRGAKLRARGGKPGSRRVVMERVPSRVPKVEAEESKPLFVPPEPSSSSTIHTSMSIPLNPLSALQQHSNSSLPPPEPSLPPSHVTFATDPHARANPSPSSRPPLLPTPDRRSNQIDGLENVQNINTDFDAWKERLFDLVAPYVDPVQDGVIITASYFWGILKHFGTWTGTFLIHMQKPFGIILFLYFLSYVGLWFAARLEATVLRPVCSVPGARFILPVCSRFTAPARTLPSDLPGPAQQADFKSLAELEDQALTPLLISTAGNSAFSNELKYAEFAIEDVITHVVSSKMSSRDSIVETLNEFLDDARRSARALQNFNAEVAGAVDTVLAISDFAAKQISAAPEASVLMSWRKSKDVVVVEEFGRAMDVLSSEMAQLSINAEENMQYLKTLDVHLKTLNKILRTESGTNDASLDVILSSLWTNLGGNRDKIHTKQRNAELLKRVGSYREEARARVVSVTVALESLDADIRTLRKRAAAPAIVGQRIPVEVHLAAIQAGVERLREGRLEARRVGDAERRRVGEAEKRRVERAAKQ